jgi:hypothetical protein
MTDRLPLRGTSSALLFAIAAALGTPSPARATGSGVAYSGSAYVDYMGAPDRNVANHSPQGVAPATSIKIGMDINDELSFSAKACIGCHGIDAEHVAIDYQPKTWFNLQVGRIAVPFGDFSNRVDPGSYHTGSPPLIYDMGRMAFGSRTEMNLGVLPLPYVDTGALVYGVKWLGERIQVWYGIYGVSGLRGSNDIDWMAMRSLPYIDNNRVPSGGGRLALSYSADPGAFFGDASIGGSYTAGRYDKSAKLAYQVWAADATLRFGSVVLRGEYAARRTDLDPNATGYPFALIDPWFRKDGFYGEVEVPLGKYLTAVYRYEELRRMGTPLPGAIAEMSADSRFKRQTGGIVVTPAQSIFLKLSWEYWQTSDLGDFHTYHAGIGGTF